MQDYVKGKSVVITGGSSGFGLETAKMLLARQAKVTITGRNAMRLAAAAKELNHADLLAVQADAVNTADWKQVVQQTIDRFGRIDVLINNHGAGVEIAQVEKLSDETIERILDINLTSVIKGCREVIPAMKANNRGHIINVSSGCARHSWASWATYTAAKAGLVAFTRCLHLEMSAWGGKATSFIPGAARTSFCDAAGIESSWLDGYPSGEDFARTIVHCVDVPDNTFIEEVNIWGTKQVPEMVNPF
ncbi:MAG: SDR family oxidoreductase [Planctomycetes bacterium]|nr:SDR family oxidoreductase [Planctomycetota bacterium]